MLNNVDERTPSEESDRVMNTIHGYGNDDGFTIVTRRHKKERTNKIRTIEQQPSNMASKKVKRLNMPVVGNNGVKHQGKRAKAHYI